MTVEPLQPRLTRKRLSDHVDFDRLCRLLGVDSWEKVDDRNVDCYGWDPDASEEENVASEQEYQGELFRRYYDAVTGVAEEVFGEHGLVLEPVLSRKSRKDPEASRRPWELRIVPRVSWADAADRVRRTINGVGVFGFDSLRDFLSSGPYTARSAVLQHTGWIPDWYEVYEGGKARSRVEGRMRY